MEPAPKNPNRRIAIFPKDIVNITGRNERTARRLLQKIRIALRKHPEEFVTAREFCKFYGLDEDMVEEYMNR